MDQPYRVLMVCTGNICRSPAAEAWMRMVGGESVAVTSAGTAALVGSPVYPMMAALMRQAGLPVGGFAARQVTPALVKQANLVLTMTTEHRRWVVGRVPSYVRRTFTLLEFARLARLAEAETGAGTVAYGQVMHNVRALTGHVRARLSLESDDEAGLDVPDPYGQDQAAYSSAFELIRTAVAGIAGPPAPPTTAPVPPAPAGLVEQVLGGIRAPRVRPAR